MRCFIYLVLTVLFLVTLPCVLARSVPAAPDARTTDSFIQDLYQGGERPDERSDAARPNFVVLMLKMLGALCLVLALIVLSAWLGKRYLPSARRALAGPDAIQILSVRSLGARRSLLIVRARGRCLLLGCTPSSITRLADLDMPPGGEPEDPDSPSFEAELAAFSREPQ